MIVFLLIFDNYSNYMILLIFENIFCIILFNYTKNINIIGLTGTIGSGKSTIIRKIE